MEYNKIEPTKTKKELTVHNQKEFDAIPREECGKEECGKIFIKPTESNTVIVVTDLIRCPIVVYGNCHLITRCSESRTITTGFKLPNSICAFENSSVEAYDCAYIEAYDNSSIEAHDLNGQIRAKGNSCAEVHNAHYYSSRSELWAVTALDNSHIKVYGSTRVNASANSVVEAFDNCQVDARDNANIIARGKCKISAQDEAVINSFGGCRVNVEGSACVEAHDNSYVEGSPFGSNYSIRLYDRASAYSDDPSCIVRLSNYAKILRSPI